MALNAVLTARANQARQAWHRHRDLNRWALRTIYAIAPRLTVGMAIASFLAGLTPVLVFLSIRGLLNASLALGDGADIGIAELTPWLLLLFVASISEAIVSLTRKLLRNLLLGRTNIELSARIMRQAARQPIAFFEMQANQNTLEKVQGQVATRLVELIHRLMLMLTTSLQVLTLVAILTFIDPLIIVVAVPLFVPYLLFQIRLSLNNFSEHEHRNVTRRRIGYFVGLLTQKAWAAEVRLLGLAPHLTASFRQVMEGFRASDEHSHRIDYKGSMLFALLTLCGFFAVFAGVVNDALTGAATIGDVAIFAAAVVRLRKALEELSTAISSSVEQAGYIEALRSFLSLPGEETAAAAAANVDLTDFEPEIRCEHVDFRYPGTDTLVLDDLNLHIRPGETIAIVGENGCGKSTLVKLLAGFYTPSAGHITLSGHDITTLSPDALRRRIAFVFQDFGRYADSVGDNIAYGDWERLRDDRAAVEAIAERTGIAERITAMPDGYDTMLGRDFGNFEPSGGIWQKIAIARTFARDAPLLILDEPTASVDAKAEFALFQQLNQLAVGKTTLLISHRFSTVSMAQRILVMYRGRIVEQGSHKELLALNGHYAELYGYYERRMTGGWGCEPSVSAD